VSIDDGGGGAVMTEVDLQLAEVFALLQQMGGIAVAQRLLTLLISSLHRRSITVTIHFVGLRLNWCVPCGGLETRSS
jgi:hypothetical protein